MILTTLLEPFQFSFMVNALVISTIVAVPCALLSVFLVLKGWALMGDAMSHAFFQDRSGLYRRHPAGNWRICRWIVLRDSNRIPRR